LKTSDVARVIRDAAAHGRTLSAYEAKVYLGAREILEREPQNLDAQEVVREFSEFMRTGKPGTSFRRFRLPLPRTEEDLAKLGRPRC
jgi:hypothetical protein